MISFLLLYWVLGAVLALAAVFNDPEGWERIKCIEPTWSVPMNVSLYVGFGGLVAIPIVIAQALRALWTKLKGG